MDVAPLTKRPPLLRRLPLRFSLRTFALFVSIVGVLLGWFGKLHLRVRQQRQIIAEIREAGGDVRFDYQFTIVRDSKGHREAPPSGSKLMRLLLGDDVYAYVVQVDFSGGQARDANLARLRDLPRLQGVYVRGKGFTDEGMRYLTGVSQLKGLNLSDTSVTAEGLSALAGATRLENLCLYGSDVTDETLESVDQLKSLKDLNVTRSSVTSAGLAPVGRIVGLQTLSLFQNPKIDGFALAHLTSLKELNELEILCSPISDNCLIQLKELPQLKKTDVVAVQRD